MPEDFWFNTPKKGIMVFALPGELGLTELAGDFKIQFHDRQGDFYCWLNTTMMENRKTLSTSDLDGFDKRKLPSPGFQVEVVLADYNGSAPPKPSDDVANKEPASASASTAESNIETRNPDKSSGSQDKDDVFSDSEAEDGAPPKPRRANTANSIEGPTGGAKGFEAKALQEETASIAHGVKQVSLKGEGPPMTPGGTELRNDGGLKSSSAVPETSELGSRVSEFKAIAADASVFSFGDEDEYDSE